MAEKFVIYKTCNMCNGDKTIKQTIRTPDLDDSEVIEDITCPQCNGTGEYEWGRMVKKED